MRPRLRRSLDARLLADGSVLLLRSPAQGDLVLEGDGRALADLLRRLDGTRDVDQLARELAQPSEVIAAALGELGSAGAVDDADGYAGLADRRRARYDRQLDFFADQLGGACAAAEAQRRLAASSVCILGLGGLGSWVAWGLVSAGVGRIVGVDGDVVELSNLNRQILYRRSDVGRRKAEAAGDALLGFDPEVAYVGVDRQLTSALAVREVVADADLVVTTIDQPPHLGEHWVQEAAFAEGIPVLAMTQHPPFIRVGPLYRPGTTGCLNCQERRWRETWAQFQAVEQAEPVRSPSSTYGPACGVVGAMAAGEAVAALTGLYEPATLGAEQIIDLSTMTVERREVPRLPGCDLCGRSEGRRHDV